MGTQLFTVNGLLTSNGAWVDVHDADSFGSGLYRLIDYTGGSLADGSTFIMGATPGGGYILTISTADAGYIDLLVSGSGYTGNGGPFRFWDGGNMTSLGDGLWHGGDGIWSATNTNWANEAANENSAYNPAAQLVFAGAAGTVTVDEGGVTAGAGGLQFAADGYTITGGHIVLGGTVPFSVNSGVGATIASAIIGSGSLSKTGAGTLTLTNTNSYSGDTTVNGGTLSIKNGGSIYNSSGYIGYDTGSVGMVTVDGAGSTWTNSGYLDVGDYGSGTLSITDGGSVFSNGYDSIGYYSGSNGTVTVDGVNSKWTNSAGLAVGLFGRGALNITNGGNVSSDGDGDIGLGTGSIGTVTVDGAGSTWTGCYNLLVGELGSGTLNITNGGSVSNIYGFIGYNSASDNTVTVDGAGSTWTNKGSLAVGDFGSGTLNITNGGSVSNSDGAIGWNTGGYGTVTVDGAGSIWTNNGYLSVGGHSGSGTLSIINGGSVSNVNGYIGDSDPGSDGMVTVDGANSKWANSGNLYVGGSGTGTLNITNGGSVFSNRASYIGYGTGSDGTVTVDGANSKWTNSGNLYVGSLGSGVLNITGGLVRVTDTTQVGYNSDSGRQSAINLNSGTLDSPTVIIGNHGTLSGVGTVTGSVTVVSGGTLTGASGGTLSMGNLSLYGGTVNVSLGAVSSPELFNVSGNLSLYGGMVNVSDAGSFGSGLYRLIGYGTLTGSVYNLGIGTMPEGYTFSITTADLGYIDLLVGISGHAGTGGPFRFWDGINMTSLGDGEWHGGPGTWNATNTNWANEGRDGNDVYDPTAQLVFTGMAGTVTVDSGGVSVGTGGLQFVSDGYRIEGGNIAIGDATPFAVNSGISATIASAINGVGGINGAGGSLVKTGAGMLTLSGDNFYTGATTINAGTLALSGSGSIAASSGVNLATGGVFDISGTTAGATIRALNNTAAGQTGTVELGSQTLTINYDGGAFGGVIEGEGGLTVGGGKLWLTGANIYTGLTTINTYATLSIGDDTHSGSIMGTVNNNGELFFQNVSDASGTVISNNGLSVTWFFGTSTAGSATITNNGAGATDFWDNSTADNATITNNNGGTSFYDNSTAGNARLVNASDNSRFDFSDTSGPDGDGKVSAGSIAGGGFFYLGNNELTVGGNNDSTTVSGVIADNTMYGDTGGRLVKTGSGTLTLTGINTYTGGTTINGGTLQLAATGTTSTDNLGTGGVDIAPGGTLLANTNGGFTFDNALTGSGTLSAANSGGAFNFGSGVGLAFAGTVALRNGTFNLSGMNTTALTNATLVIGAGNTTAVGTGPQSIGGLAFDGGTMIFDASAPDQKVATDLLTVTDLDVSGTGAVQINVPAPYVLPTPTPDNSLSLFAQSHVNEGLQLVAATTVTGSAGGLTLQDQSGNALGQDRNVNISQNGNTVAIGHYNYMLGTGSANDGLYVGYGLNQLDLQAGQTLTLTENSGATGNDADLAAKLTGSGNLAIAATDTVSLSNPTNSFTGTTEISSGTLQAGAANVIASSSAVTLDAGTTFDTNGYNQSLNNLSGVSTSRVLLSDGNTLSLNGGIAANTYTGVISGNGSLLQNSGWQILTGDNTYDGGTMLNAGRIDLGSNSALGSGALSMADGTTLGFAGNYSIGNAITLNGVGTFDTAGNNGTLAGVISGTDGALTKTGAGTLTLSGANTYTGLTEVQAGTLALSGAGRISDTLALYDGATFSLTNGASAGNLTQLDVYGRANWQGNLNMAGQTVNFYVPATMASGQTMLTVTNGNANIGGSTLTWGFAGDDPVLQAGDQIKLIDVTTVGNALIGTPDSVTGRQGATLDYTFYISETDNQLVATVADLNVDRAKPLSEGFISGSALINQTTDFVADQGIMQAVEAAGGGQPGTDKQGRSTTAGGYGQGTFGAVTGGWSRYSTGSHADISSLSLMAGLAWGNDIEPGRLTLGAFFEYGNGSYDTYNSFAGSPDVHGEGDMYHMGGGILARMDFTDAGPGMFYTEASVRMGNLHNDYKNGNFQGGNASYESDAVYYGLHVAVGHIWRFTEKTSFDLSGKYLWTRQNSDSVLLSTGDPISFDGVNSERLRLGGRFSYAVNDFITPYLGAAYEYEFDGQAKARAYGYDIQAPSLRGGTGIGELGLAIKPAKYLPLFLDLGLRGYVGIREGFTGSLQVKYEF